MGFEGSAFPLGIHHSVQHVLPQLSLSFYGHQLICADFSAGQITCDAGLLPLYYFDQPLLILDDLGMRKLPLTAGEELLEIIMRRYERASTMLTSNRPVEDWSKLLGDSAAVSALMDGYSTTATCSSAAPEAGGTKTDLPPQEAAG